MEFMRPYFRSRAFLRDWILTALERRYFWLLGERQEIWISIGRPQEKIWQFSGEVEPGNVYGYTSTDKSLSLWNYRYILPFDDRNRNISLETTDDGQFHVSYEFRLIECPDYEDEINDLISRAAEFQAPFLPERRYRVTTYNAHIRKNDLYSFFNDDEGEVSDLFERSKGSGGNFAKIKAFAWYRDNSKYLGTKYSNSVTDMAKDCAKSLGDPESWSNYRIYYYEWRRGR
ncbi:hypothetical protein [Nitrospirillum iridis]|nr:hypothetical protein [Nitrospirillum iridis]